MRQPWRTQLAWNPFGTMASLAAIVLGSLGVIMGDRVSQGMTNSLAGHANVVAHLWGIMFTAGGVLKLYGLYAGRTTVEIPGLWMLGGGYAFYALTVVTGLRMHGLAAGIIATAMTLGCLLKIRIIMTRARTAADLADQDDR